MSERQEKEYIIFKAVAKLKTAAERIAYIEKVCGDDLALKARIMALLEANEDKGDFLDVLIQSHDVTLDESPLTEKPGTKIGRYKLLELIGEGGFGMVYMAEQEKPIRRRVALKIIKLGMDTRQVIGRFEAERQALAMMDHPNIAKVLDAGATETGRPYFVMELVKGIPITEYCDKNNLDTRKRLKVFTDVCKAIQHAHQKGIIHRDLKPSNVMITLRDDDSPVPKIIDFGIAKATQARLTEKTLFTGFKQFIGTQEYMSPEQAKMGELDVDTRSDIYSLGVLLYELLTGTTPFEAKQLRSAAFDEIVRIIREEEPDKPSTRLSTLGGTLAEIAKNRHVEPAELRKIVRGDLDWIVMKALEKDRTHRYETASEFARDILRYLNNEPVHASPPSIIYKTRKYIRRHRTSVVAGLVFMTSLIIGFSLAIAGFMQASHQRDLAEANFRKAREAVDQMLTHVAEELPRLPGISKQLDSAEVTKIKQALLESALKYYEGFLEERSSDLNVRYETAHAYMRVGDITRSMDQDKRAEETYFAAANLLEELAAEFPNEFDYHKDLAFAYHGYGDMLRNAGRTKEKNDVYRKSAISYENAFKLNQNDAFSWHDCANVYDELGQPYKAISYLSEAIKLNPNSAFHWQYRANVYRELEQWDKALTDLSKAIELEPDNANYWCIRAETYDELGQKEKADADYSKAIELYSKVIELRPRAYWIWTERANVYRELEQWDKALADSNKAIELDPSDGGNWCGRADVYRELEQWDKALADYNKAIELKPDYAGKWCGRAEVYRQIGQFDKAIADSSKAIELEPSNEWPWHIRADVYRKLGQWDKALADSNKAIELDPGASWPLSIRADVYRELGQWDEAVADYTKAIELDPNDSGRWITRANTYSSMEQWNKARTDYSKAIELDPNNASGWYFNSLAYLGMGDTEDYRNRCAQMLEHFGQTQKAAAAHWVAWTCALAPKAVEDLDKVVELAKLAIEKGEQTDQNRNALGAVLYRAGRFDEAVQKLSDLASEWEQGRELPTEISPAYTWFFLSMAYHQLGKADQAQYWFNKALERAEEELQGEPAWNRKLTLKLLREEVTQLLDISQETVTTGEENE